MPEAPLLSVSTRTDGTEATIAVAGEFDLSTSPSFDSAFNQVLERQVYEVRVDGGELTFADSVAIVTLLRAREAAEAQHVKFRLARPSRALQRVLSLAGLEETFDTVDA